MREQISSLLFYFGGVFVTQIRIRSIVNGEASPWLYTQDEIKQETPKAKVFKIEATPVTVQRSRVNQYGRFRYSEMQYGEIERLLNSSIEVSTKPIRIKAPNGSWIYSQQAVVDGACPAIRIRSKYGNSLSPWVYIQQEEV